MSVKRQMKRRSVKKKEAQTLILDEMFSMYLRAKEIEGMAKATISNKGYSFKVVNDYMQTHDIIYIDDVDTETIREFIYYLKHEHLQFKNNSCLKDVHKTVGVADSTINLRIRAMKAFYNWMIEESYIELNPFNRIKLIREDTEIESFSIEQVKQLLKVPNRKAYAGFRDYVLIVLLLDTGMRIGECIGLKVDSIDLMENIIRLKSHETKGKRGRQIPVSQKTNKLIRELLIDVEEFGSEYLFLTVYGNKIEPQRFRNKLKEYGEIANIEGVRVSPHTFRHTFARAYILNGGDVISLQRILGHKSLDMTRRYINMSGVELKQLHNKFSIMNNL